MPDGLIKAVTRVQHGEKGGEGQHLLKRTLQAFRPGFFQILNSFCPLIYMYRTGKRRMEVIQMDGILQGGCLDDPFPRRIIPGHGHEQIEHETVRLREREAVQALLRRGNPFTGLP